MSHTRVDPAQRPGTMGHRQVQQPPDAVPDDVETVPAEWTLRGNPAERSRLSVVVPAKDEAASLPQLAEEIVRALRPLCNGAGEADRPGRLSGFEVLIVDDGSTDQTPVVLEELARLYPEIRRLRLRSNAGQSAAIAAGIDAAQGEWIATLDADLQNDPADLATLWEALPGHDVALGWRVRRADVWSRRAISRVANRVRNAVLGQSIRDTGCSVRIFPRAVALRLPLFRGVHRFFGPLFLREGCRVVQVPVNHRPRPHGRSHYNFRNRSFRVVADLLGVAWLMRRPVRYEVEDDRDGGRVHSPSARGVALQTGEPTSREA
jgi:dolichol-phosphate mannosyltransferase